MMQSTSNLPKASSIPPMEAVVAVLLNSNGIGLNGNLPWLQDGLTEDMKHFVSVTCSSEPLKFISPSMYKQSSSSSPITSDNTNDNTTTINDQLMNAVIMGRKTWESIPSKFKPLSKNRHAIILSSKVNDDDQLMMERTTFVKNVDELFELLQNQKFNRIFIAGGTSIYKLLLPYTAVIHYTNIIEQKGVNIQVDTRFPIRLLPSSDYRNVPINSNQFIAVDKSDKILPKNNERISHYEFITFERRHEEFQYLDIIKELILSDINVREERTGVGTVSKFGYQMKYSLRNNVFPLLTTKRVFWKGVAKELFWFISGSTNAKILSEQDIHIWDGNGSREYLDSLGFENREEMDLGPVYGFQWRHWGSSYENMHTDYTNKGVDQLKKCIETLKNNPTNRRIILSAWNVSDLPNMALPPCHLMCQFWVDTDTNELSCQMYQRSCDMGLGVPFNIASYALLTRLMAQVCNLKPGDFIHTLGDTHVYKNHIEPLKKQIERDPKHFPLLLLDPSITNIDDFKFEHLTLQNYEPHATIKMEMAV
ncbi:predicted protein [Naegleria gruberi]|uniref:Bifunctional dihydrofolate reductase-thymidylate synthase n=1 Tax=Naegleria gruberi TaxID=5762 RepID=D2W4C0_NAEGR|nr:uncharacterized protein NAEGRDRAFT_76251 [Naegleria gruberi]EFC36084.1 predicted protein [Naegleria gruberi]|eukprot:XP_002668828.1 predicted protein [Naegleria gruberi strain NEG-M]